MSTMDRVDLISRASSLLISKLYEKYGYQNLGHPEIDDDISTVYISFPDQLEYDFTCDIEKPIYDQYITVRYQYEHDEESYKAPLHEFSSKEEIEQWVQQCHNESEARWKEYNRKMFAGLKKEKEKEKRALLLADKQTGELITVPLPSKGCVLSDGSAFFTAKFPLPKDHWIYDEVHCVPEKYLRCGTDNKLLRLELVGAVKLAARLAIKQCTDHGKDMDFDPDALVQALIVNMVGHNTPDGLTYQTNDDPNPALPQVVRILRDGEER